MNEYQLIKLNAKIIVIFENVPGRKLKSSFAVGNCRFPALGFVWIVPVASRRKSVYQKLAQKSAVSYSKSHRLSCRTVATFYTIQEEITIVSFGCTVDVFTCRIVPLLDSSNFLSYTYSRLFMIDIEEK